MPKVLTVDPEKCTGCRICEIACSVNKEGAANPRLSRIKVIKWEMEGFYVPMFCQQCEDPLCAAVCPVNAVSRDEYLGRVFVNEELCVGCRACISACAFGAVGYDQEQKRALRCDLCDGDPVCVKFCDTRALQYVDTRTVQLHKQRAAAEKMYHHSSAN